LLRTRYSQNHGRKRGAGVAGSAALMFYPERSEGSYLPELPRELLWPCGTAALGCAALFASFRVHSRPILDPRLSAEIRGKGYFPFHTGFRFSIHAATPSFTSSVCIS